MKKIWMKTACIFLLCTCLSSCYYETTKGGTDGVGIAFPQPGTSDKANTEISNDMPVTDVPENDADATDSIKVDVNENDADATDSIKADVPEDDADATDSIKVEEKDEKNDTADTVTPQVPIETPDDAGGNNIDVSGETERDNVPEDDEWMLILVNPWNYLPEDYEVKLVNLGNNQKADERVYPELQKMMDDMRAEDLSPYICSSYRTLAKQTNLYNKQIKQYTDKGYSEADAKVEAGRWVAVPGTSEHHTGLAFDIVAAYHIVLDESQENTKEQQWLMKNSWKYGFILRYPNGKTDITGIYYEPWHYRYVGKKAAKEIYESGLTLEEYLRNME